jgi:mannose-1-phosphate guanylyltransferase
MTRSDHTWALILAAGEGARLRELTADGRGMAVPKQYCSLRGGPSLLQETIERASRVALPGHISLIVAEQHRAWWQSIVRTNRVGQIVVQPRNRGTAIGILLQLLTVMRVDPGADVVLLPSDHFVANELVLGQSLVTALGHVRVAPQETVLLGIEPTCPDPELGYIVPGAADHCGAWQVDEFVEKPNAVRAQQLIRGGAMWNAFIIVARAYTLLQLIERRVPDIVRRLTELIDDKGAVADLYEQLPAVDFSHEVLTADVRQQLRVLRVPCCGWNDLGTPARVAQTLSRLPIADTASMHGDAPINLAMNFQRRATADWPVARVANS